MNASEVIAAIENDDISKMEEVLEVYPWFGPAHVHKARVLQESNDPSFPDNLSKAAIFAGSPGVLYDIIVGSQISEVDGLVEVVEEVTDPVNESNVVDRSDEVDSLADEEEAPPAAPEEAPSAEGSQPAKELDDLEKQIITGAVSRSIEQEVGEASAPLSLEGGEEEESEKGEEKSEKGEEKSKKRNERSEREVESEGLSPFAAYLLKRSEEIGFEGSKTKAEPPVKESSHAEPSEPKERSVEALVDDFIKKEPKITPRKVEDYSTEDLAKKSLVEHDSFVTETMAKVYAAQGKLEKARRAYRLLSLKYPEKSVYFAAQLKNLGKKTND